MEILNICVSDIPKHLIKKTDNGKSYMTICVSEMKQADKYGNTYTVFMGQNKEERTAKADKIYIGNGKVINFGKPNPLSAEDIADMPQELIYDLPF